MLLEWAAADVEAGGICLEVLRPHADDPHNSLPPLRFLGAIHRMVLDGRAPELARHYPSAGGTPGADLWDAFLHTLDQNRAAVEEWIDNPVQTNEVGRSAALLGGFLVVAETTGLDLRLLEVGASAGLNLRWDFYRYESGDRAWGPDDSPVLLTGVFAGSSPPLEVVPRVVERSGCDLRPLDPNSPEDRLTLLSYVWPDQTERLELLRQALDIARRVPAPVDAASATDWLASKLAAPAPGVATVVFHSIVTPYLGEAGREELTSVISAAGQRATEPAPLAWLRLEPGVEQGEVRLTIWPDGAERLIATAGYHGRPVHWRHH